MNMFLRAYKRNYNVYERLIKASFIRDNNAIHQKLKHVSRWMKPLDVISLRSFIFSSIHWWAASFGSNDSNNSSISISNGGGCEVPKLLLDSWHLLSHAVSTRCKRFTCSNVQNHWQKECAQFNRVKRELEIQRFFLQFSRCRYEYGLIIMVNV